jgi:hypothetical protein
LLFQPAQLLPLRNILLGLPPGPEIAKYEDIVEATYAVRLPIVAGYPPSSRFRPPSEPAFHTLAKGISQLGRQMAKTANKSLSRQEAWAHAARAICGLMAYAIPSRPRQGHLILREIAGITPSPNWGNHVALFYDLYSRLSLSIFQARKPQFQLGPQMNAHTHLCYSILYLDHVLRFRNPARADSDSFPWQFPSSSNLPSLSVEGLRQGGHSFIPSESKDREPFSTFRAHSEEQSGVSSRLVRYIQDLRVML